MNLPILKPEYIEYKKYFIEDNGNYNEIDDFYDKIVETYHYKILDIFSQKLDKDSTTLLKLNSEYFRLTQEEKYLNFIYECFQANNYNCYIEIDINFNDYENYLYFNKKLDEIDKHILLYQFIKLNESNSKIYLVEDINLLKMFIKGILRELFNCIIFFKQKPLLIFSNYDMSLPIVIKNLQDENFYKQLARKNKLYFR